MPDPRTVLRETLDSQLHIARLARDTLWEDYWQRRRVVVVPENDAYAIAKSAYKSIQSMDGPEIAPIGGWVSAQRMEIVRDCIARLKAAREKDAVNKNLSTLLAVVVKVQRDLEALLNGSRAE